MKTKYLLASIVATGLLSACVQQQTTSPEVADGGKPATSAASPAPRVRDVVRLTVPGGTELQVTLSTSIGSATSQVGDDLTATTTSPVVVGDRVAIPAGTTIHGRVTDVVAAHKGWNVSEKGGSLVLAFNKLTTPRGDSTSMSGSLTQLASSKGKTAGIIGGSAAGGAVLGKILGGDTKDAAIGAVVGTGIGTGIAAGTKGKELEIPAGTHFAITLDQPLVIVDPA